jgi:hypothetical protein
MHARTHRPHRRLGAEGLDVRARKALRPVHHRLDLLGRERVAVLAQQQRDERQPRLGVGQGDVEPLDETAARGLVQLVGAVGGADHQDAVLFVFVCFFVGCCEIEWIKWVVVAWERQEPGIKGGISSL